MTNVIPLKTFQPLNKQEDLDKRIRDASEMFEEQFLSDMVKAMRATVDHSELTSPSFSEEIYRSHLDQEYVKSWVGRGGLGLADLIETQIREKMGMNQKQKIQGPLPLDSKNNFKLLDKSDVATPNKLDLEVQTQDEQPITSLFEAEIKNSFKTDLGQSVLDIRNADGVNARYISSKPFLVETGNKIKAGQPISAPLDKFYLQLTKS